MNGALSLPVLHRRFRSEASFRQGAGSYQLLPMRFLRLDESRVVISNMVGEFLVVPRSRLADIIEHRVERDESLYADLVARHLVLDPADNSALDLLALKYRTRQSHLAEFTGLHMFVVTLRCDHSCPYCQVSRVSHDRTAFDMSEGTARQSIDLMFQSPSKSLKVEFQGGEPLLNFELIRYVVERVKAHAEAPKRDIQFVVATNLANLTDEMLSFLQEHRVMISTSLDGPANLHNANRPRPEKNSYELAVRGIERCREALGYDCVSALMTTTLRSLEQPEVIVDEYVRLGFGSIFLRSLSPYGFATKSQKAIGYASEQWNQFYERGLLHILKLAAAGTPIRETYASIVLRKMLTSFPGRYVDLQSPAGIGISAAVYNYDGDVYASDEGRMLAEMGDRAFRLGNVHTDGYRDIFLSDRLIDLVDRTMTEAIPHCSQCAFEPWCGTDPTFHHATQGDAVGHRPTSGFCHRNMFVMRLLVKLLTDEPKYRGILESWAR